MLLYFNRLLSFALCEGPTFLLQKESKISQVTFDVITASALSSVTLAVATRYYQLLPHTHTHPHTKERSSRNRTFP